MPETKPALRSVATDRDGRIWVDRYVTAVRHADIGRALASPDRPPPRPNFPSDAVALTVDTCRAIWDPLTAQAGTYAIEIQHLVTRPRIAKMPAMMQSSSFNRYEMRVAGDTMWLRPVENQKGALPSAPRHMLVRAER